MDDTISTSAEALEATAIACCHDVRTKRTRQKSGSSSRKQDPAGAACHAVVRDVTRALKQQEQAEPSRIGFLLAQELDATETPSEQG